MVADVSDNYPEITEWSSGAFTAREVELRKEWHCNMVFLHKVYLQEIWIYLKGSASATVNVITFKRASDKGGWQTTSVARNQSISSIATDMTCYQSAMFRIRQENLEATDYTGSKEWQIDFTNYKDNGTAVKLGFRVQYANQ